MVSVNHASRNSGQGPVSRKSRGLFGPENTTCSFCKAGFSYVVKGIKIKITARFRASRCLRFEDAKRIITRNTPEKFSGLSRNGPLYVYTSSVKL